MSEGIDQLGLPTDDASARPGYGRLKPVKKRWPWITSGLVLQLIGAGAPIAYVLDKAHKEDIGGQISKATLTLAWRQAIHSHTGLGLLIGGAAVFALGSILMARPFVKSWVTLLIAIPLAAIAGVLVLGAAAIVVALIIAGADDLLSFWSDTGTTSSSRKRKRQPPDDQAGD